MEKSWGDANANANADERRIGIAVVVGVTTSLVLGPQKNIYVVIGVGGVYMGCQSQTQIEIEWHDVTVMLHRVRMYHDNVIC